MKNEKIPLQIFENCGRETWYQFSLALYLLILVKQWLNKESLVMSSEITTKWKETQIRNDSSYWTFRKNI
jgi:hypothetical protein